MQEQDIKDLIKEIKETKDQTLHIDAICHDCQCDIHMVFILEDEHLNIDGGAMYKPADANGRAFFKCNHCFEINKKLTNYVDCEVYSRIVGYMRPVGNWNKGKQAEWKMRKIFKEKVDVR